MRSHDAIVSKLTKSPPDRRLWLVLAVFIAIVGVAWLFVWLDQPDSEDRGVMGTVTELRPVKSRTLTSPNATVTVVKLDDGSTITCGQLAHFGIGSRVTVVISRSGLLGRDIARC